MWGVAGNYEHLARLASPGEGALRLSLRPASAGGQAGLCSSQATAGLQASQPEQRREEADEDRHPLGQPWSGLLEALPP